MKNISIILLLFSISFCYSQRPGIALETTDHTGTKEEVLNYDAIGGTPFLNNNFIPAKAVCCNETAPMRYDMYADEIQYKKGDVIFTLLKEEPYSKIVFTNPNTTIVLADVDKNNHPSYYIALVDGKNSLLKKVIITIQSDSDTKKTGFGKKDQSSSFKENQTLYYIKTEKNTYRLLKNKKDILDLYPEKSRELNNFFDSNSIRFNKDESLIKLVNFINK